MRRGGRNGRGDGLRAPDGAPDVVGHDQHAHEVEHAAEETHDVERMHRLHRLDERVGQRAVGVDRAPHQTLHHARDPHGRDVEHDADGGDPEMRLDEAGAVYLAVEQPRDQEVQGADRDHADPAERAGVHVADGPVGVVRQRVHRLDGHHRALEGGHAVERHRHDQELEDRIGAQFLPRARQGHDAVDHAAPARRQQDQREHHAERLGPVGQRRVVQVVRTGPDVGEDQRPEVHDREAVRIHRPLRLLGDEVVHDAEEAGGQEETDGVVAVPPLHHGVLHAGVDRVRLGPRHRQRRAVDHVQQGDGQDERAVEPVGDVDVAHAALGERAEEHDRVGDPHHGNQNVDRPFELGVLLGGGDAERQRDGRRDDHRLPAPEAEGREPAGEQPHMAGALHDVIRSREQRRAAEGEHHGVGVQRPQAREREPGNVEIERRPGHLRGDDHADQHADDAPDHGHDGKLPHDPELVGGSFAHVLPCPVT